MQTMRQSVKHGIKRRRIKVTASQKKAIDAKDEEGLRKQISALKVSKAENKEELILYCEQRLEALNTNKAMVEFSPLDDFGDL